MKILKVKLTQAEQELYTQIHFQSQSQMQLSDMDLKTSANAATSLILSLLDRKAIPENRIRYFTDPDLNIGTKISHKEVFEKNGTSGKNIFRHRNFLPYLQYFIFGPDLPKETIDVFSQIISAESFISGSDVPGLRKFVRSETRKYRLIPKEACEEFNKLALECGINNELARILRDDVRMVR